MDFQHYLEKGHVTMARMRFVDVHGKPYTRVVLVDDTSCGKSRARFFNSDAGFIVENRALIEF
jgi:hypothetical protein